MAEKHFQPLYFFYTNQQFHSLSCGGQFWYGVLMTVMASQAKYSRGTMIGCNSIVIGSYIFAVQSLSRSRMLLILCWWDDESKWAQFGVLSLLPFNCKGKGLFITIWWWPRSVSVNHVFTDRRCTIHILELLHPLCRVI